MDVDNPCFNAICCQFLCCFQRCCHTKTICHNSQIFTFTKNDAFTNLKFVIWCVVDHRHCQTSETHINRSYIFVSCLDHCFGFNIISRRHNYHARNCSHKRKILTALMCSTVFANRNTTMGSTNFYVQFRICNRITKLFISTSCCKHCESTCKRNFTCSRKSCCNTHHVTFCNTTVNMTFREFFFEHSSLSSCSKVSIQNDKILMFFTKLYQSCSITCSCSDFLYF